MSQETFKLLFTNGPREGDQIPLGDNITTLGRSKRNTIILDDPSISREHLRFYVEDDNVSVEDPGSSRGTLLNGQALTGRVVLKHGDDLDVGKQQIKVISLSETLDGDDEVTIFENFEEIEEKFNSESQVNIKQAKVRVQGNTAQVPAPAATPPPAPVVEEDAGDHTRVLDDGGTRVFDAGEMMQAVNAGAPAAVPAPAAPKKSIVPLLAGAIIAIAIALAGLYIYQQMNSGGGGEPPPSSAGGWDYQPVRVAPDQWNAKIEELKAGGWEITSEPKMETDSDGNVWMVSLFKKPK